MVSVSLSFRLCNLRLRFLMWISALHSRQSRKVGMATQENHVVKQRTCVGTGVRTFLRYFSSEGHFPSHLKLGFGARSRLREFICRECWDNHC